MPHPLSITFSGWPSLTLPNKNRRHQKFSHLPITSSTNLSEPVTISGAGVFYLNLTGAGISARGQICHVFIDSTLICILRIFVPSSILLPLSHSLVALLGLSYQHSTMLSFKLKTIKTNKPQIYPYTIPPSKPSPYLSISLHSQAS